MSATRNILAAAAVLAPLTALPAAAAETAADAPLQDGRIAMTVSCPGDCALGVRLRDTGDRALYVPLSGADYGAVYLQDLDGQGAVAGQQVLVESPGAAPFPSDDPVFIEIGLQGDELNGWTQGGRIWRFWQTLDADLPAFGDWAVVHDGAQLGYVTFENAQARPGGAPRTGAGFTARRINDLFYSETVSVGDLNGDGAPDIMTGPRYYLGPDFDVSRQIYAEETTNPDGYSSGMLSAVDDFDGDGLGDALILESGRESGAHQALAYLNPGDQSRNWDRFVALPTTQGEASAYEDIDGDGTAELIVIRENTIGIARPGADPRQPWSYRPVSDGAGRMNPHGVGVGDVDGDGRKDILHASGWFRQPAQPADEWVFTPAEFGPGAQLYVEDLNGDGRNDVVGALDAHGWGLAWWEQTAEGGFTRHLVMGDPGQTPSTDALETFSQPHAVAFADLNGDGLKDIVAGKRWWAHRNTYRDPDGQGAPVIYAFLQNREGGETRFTPRFVGDHVGVGNQIAVADLNGDGAPDIVASARKGTVVYFNALD